MCKLIEKKVLLYDRKRPTSRGVANTKPGPVRLSGGGWEGGTPPPPVLSWASLGGGGGYPQSCQGVPPPPWLQARSGVPSSYRSGQGGDHPLATGLVKEGTRDQEYIPPSLHLYMTSRCTTYAGDNKNRFFPGTSTIIKWSTTTWD